MVGGAGRGRIGGHVSGRPAFSRFAARATGQDRIKTDYGALTNRPPVLYGCHPGGPASARGRSADEALRAHDGLFRSDTIFHWDGF